jgi:NAD(P) transhydrogenase subunit alpha
MILGVPRETSPGERRVALVPSAVPPLAKQGVEVLVEAGAGAEAGFLDAEYEQRGAKLAATRKEVFERADAVAQVRAFGANLDAGADDLPLYRKGQAVIATCDPLSALDADRQAAAAGGALLSLELMPRITRAQSMDVLSSQATIAGYKAVLLAAGHLPRMFPMMMTAAGTIAAARAFVIGAGVAGLQAIATARRLGAIVNAYDVRPAVKEQVQSLGAKFVEMELEAGAAEDAGGYAKALGEDFYRKQRELMASVVAESDVVVTTAAIPGKPSPLLITKAAVEGMRPGSVIVDLAAERGGNCELTRAGETVAHAGVTILGPLDLPSTVPYHASQMFAKNVATFLLHLVKDGALVLDPEDEITAGTLVTRDGQVVHPRVRELVDAGTTA